MQENAIYVKRYTGEADVGAVRQSEIWRYSGHTGSKESISEELQSVLLDVMEEVKGQFVYQVCYRKMPLIWEGSVPKLPFAVQSVGLAKCLKGCDEVIIFAATIGLAPDRYIARYQRISPLKALLMQAYGAERIESLCDTFCEELKLQAAKLNRTCSARFSPGYGDLPLEVQREIFALLDCNRQIGVSLNESLLMMPSKSVTAILGVGECVAKRALHKCSACSKQNCEYRNVEE